MKRPSVPVSFQNSLEPLEARVAPAGVVGFVYDADLAQLTLIGDAAANRFSIFSTGPGTHRVQGDEGTVFAGGAAYLDIGKLTDLVIFGNQGADTARLFGLTGLKVLEFEGGSESDILALTNCRVQGSIEFSGGGVDDRLSLQGEFCTITGDIHATAIGSLELEFQAENNIIGGSVFFEAGGDPYTVDATAATNVSIGKGLRIESGFSGGSVALAPIGNLKIGKLPTGESLRMEGGDGDDYVFFGASNVTLASGIWWQEGGGSDTLSFFASTKSARIGKLPSGHSISMAAATDNSSIDIEAAQFTASGGIEIANAASSEINFNAPHGRISLGKLLTNASIQVGGGSSSDRVLITTSSLTMSGGIDFLSGNGLNQLVIDAPLGTVKIGKLPTKASIHYEGGTGTDTLSVRAGKLVLAGGVDFVGGGGVNVAEFIGAGSQVKIGTFDEGISIRYTGGSGPDTLRTDVANFATLGGVIFTGGADVNQLHFDSTTGVVKLGKLGSGHSILYTGGSGADTIRSDQATTILTGGIEFAGGDGANKLEMQFTGSIRMGILPDGESVKIVGGAGGDLVQLQGSLIALKGGIVISGDAGNDSLKLVSPATTIGKTRAGDSILLNGGDDADFVYLDDKVALAGSLTVIGGAGADSLSAFEARSLVVRGEVLFEGGADANQLNLYVDRLEVAKTLTFTNGSAADSAVINARGFIAGDARIDLGSASAAQSVTLGSRYNHPKGLVFRSNLDIGMVGFSDASLTISETVVLKTFSASLNFGPSTVTIDNFTGGGAFLLDTSGGDDVVMFEQDDMFGPSRIAKLATILTSSGNDTVLIGSPDTSAAGIFPDPSRVIFLGGLELDGGTGTDGRNLILTENTFPGTQPTGLETFETVVA